MKAVLKQAPTVFLLTVSVFLLFFLSTAHASEEEQATTKEGWYTQIVDKEFVKKYAVIPPPVGVTIIDSRPGARKYDKGHIPGAINIQERLFDSQTELLPEDKDSLLIFYCGGVKCMLSHKSAFKAEKLGYTNIGVYADGYPDWVAGGNMKAVSPAYVKKGIDKGKEMVVIDSRPKKRKYDKGHIPTAISISDREFDKLANLLPADKTTELIFYCGGYKCKLSGNSAVKAMALGYTNVKTLPAGFPAWKEAAYPVEKAGAKSAGQKKPITIKKGEEEGAISIDSFTGILHENPESILTVDVRDPEEYATGSLKSAVNIPINDLEKKMDDIPADKPIVFICGTGARSGEAYDIVSLLREDLNAYFLNAELTMKGDGSYEISPIKE